MGLKLYRVEISASVLVCAETPEEAERTATWSDVLLQDVRDNAETTARPVAHLYNHERGVLAWGVPDDHLWREMPVEKIVAEIENAKKGGA